MKTFRLFFIAAAAAVLSIMTAVPATAKDNAAQAKLDSMAARLAERLENGGWQFVPDSYTSSNNVSLDFYNSSGNSVSLIDDGILINIDFVGARVRPMATTPIQRGRALAGAAAAANLNNGLPDYIKTKGEVVDREVSIGKKSRSVTMKVKYNIDYSNLNLLSSTATVSLTINTRELTSRLTFYNMNIEGTMNGKIIFLL